MQWEDVEKGYRWAAYWQDFTKIYNNIYRCLRVSCSSWVHSMCFCSDFTLDFGPISFCVMRLIDNRNVLTCSVSDLFGSFYPVVFVSKSCFCLPKVLKCPADPCLITFFIMDYPHVTLLFFNSIIYVMNVIFKPEKWNQESCLRRKIKYPYCLTFLMNKAWQFTTTDVLYTVSIFRILPKAVFHDERLIQSVIMYFFRA